MLDNQQVSAFQKTGCWAACHSDMAGMDQSMGLGKYLGMSRQKLTRSGGGNNLKDAASLKALMTKGEYVDLWHAKAENGVATVSQSTILAAPQTIENPDLKVVARSEAGTWTVSFHQSRHSSHGKGFSADGRYTLGIAIHQNNKGHEHWVSLPLELMLSSGKLTFSK